MTEVEHVPGQLIMPAPDEQYLTEWSRERQAAAHRAAFDDNCGYCRHQWHGLACRGLVNVPGSRTSIRCDCPTSVKETQQ